MRWKADPAPKEGDTRNRKKFAWFPTLIGNEVVWLEQYGIEEKYTMTVHIDTDVKVPYPVLEWVVIDRYTLDWYGY